ncbi:hypothetical protein OG301_27135 [Streptomyces platensis]|uniref:hypothetical protein n=1 Tax=Streptomyces platensis TaxID=58346 RepID=UPI002E103C1B|nr:hypothetical protein OG229_11550 [Streptomyces platensis]WTI54740.1 hypothetical protein OG301_27135 [Streptomyces platensis]WUB79700.1 hypothetical protein OG424_11220 [Streptomyces platensis]
MVALADRGFERPDDCPGIAVRTCGIERHAVPAELDRHLPRGLTQVHGRRGELLMRLEAQPSGKGHRSVHQILGQLQWRLDTRRVERGEELPLPARRENLIP